MNGVSVDRQQGHTGRRSTGANPYMFIIGAARSGTTLLQRMLDAHSSLAVVNETYWVARKFRERNGLTRQGLVTPSLIPLLLASPKFRHMGVTREDLLRLLSEAEEVTYALFVERIFDLYAARQGKPLAGDKTPGYVRRIARLHELWPRARFVHIIRDPRDVCLSMLDWPVAAQTAGQDGTWEMDPALSTALYWRYSIAIGREVAATLDPALYHEVRYEDLVASPQRELRRISAFLQIPYDETMTRFHEAGMRSGAGLSSEIDHRSLRHGSGSWLPPTPGLRDWRTQLSPAEAERIEAVTGDLLDGLSYPRSAARRSPAVSDRVARAREVFTHNLQARGRPVPNGW